MKKARRIGLLNVVGHRLHIEQIMCAMWRTDRRSFLWSVTGVTAAMGAGLAKARDKDKEEEAVFFFSTPECDGRMSVQFFNGYTTKGLGFRDRSIERHFCLSKDGEENKNCLTGFAGSLAIASYHLRARESGGKAEWNLREYVRTIDQDSRVAPRPPFERALLVKGEVLSDIQAFGVDAGKQESANEPGDPWCLLRQDLYFSGQTAPFLIVHWKHALSAITLLDVIPAGRTELRNRSGRS